MSWVDVFEPAYVRAWETRQRAPVQAISSGLPTLDRCCGDDGGKRGFARGWFVTLGGNPGHGKSLLALNFAYRSVKSGQNVAFLTLEMSQWQLSTRLYAIATGKHIVELERGLAFNPNGTQAMVHEFSCEHDFATVYVNAEPIVSIAEVKTHLDSALEGGCNVIIVDYLQLVGTGAEDAIYQQVAEVATTLRQFAHLNHCTVIGLSQYNRRTSADTANRPMAQSLHGGMSLEANSDVVLLLDHSRFERDKASPHIARTWLNMGKNRHGPATDIPIQWDYRNLRVTEAQPDEEHLWP